MPAAARVGDLTSHGSPLTPLVPAVMGSPNVLIGGQPAWRALVDAHVCPQVNGVVPHVGGFVAQGSSMVFINNFSAVREGDAITEGGGGLNKIALGFRFVQIGG
jgi:uncharacterized Zn-binding protein involved in type VI secretion